MPVAVASFSLLASSQVGDLLRIRTYNDKTVGPRLRMWLYGLTSTRYMHPNECKAAAHCGPMIQQAHSHHHNSPLHLPPPSPPPSRPPSPPPPLAERLPSASPIASPRSSRGNSKSPKAPSAFAARASRRANPVRQIERRSHQVKSSGEVIR